MRQISFLHGKLGTDLVSQESPHTMADLARTMPLSPQTLSHYNMAGQGEVNYMVSGKQHPLATMARCFVS